MSFKISPMTSVEGFPSEKSSTIAYLNFEVSNLMGIVGRENSVIRTATHWLLLISHHLLSCVVGEGFYPLCLHTFQGALINILNNQGICKSFIFYDQYYFVIRPQSVTTSLFLPLLTIANLWAASLKQTTKKLATHSLITRNLKEERLVMTG